MHKRLLMVCVLLWITGNCFANTIRTTIEINGVVVQGGSVYVAVYSNEHDYKNETYFMSFILEPVTATLMQHCDVPEGEYVVSAFQDKNGDGKLNTTIFGIPLEHIGITNYNLRGVPPGFNKLKTPIHAGSAKLVVNMGRVKPLVVL